MKRGSPSMLVALRTQHRSKMREALGHVDASMTHLSSVEKNQYTVLLGGKQEFDLLERCWKKSGLVTKTATLRRALELYEQRLDGEVAG